MNDPGTRSQEPRGYLIFLFLSVRDIIPGNQEINDQNDLNAKSLILW
jgi:hypothetical protein